jgi:hypothetical protein
MFTPKSFPRAMAGVSMLLATAGALPGAQAALVKPYGSPPLVMPNTLALEHAGAAAAALGTSRSYDATCAAAAVRLPRVGTRLVTARHCANGSIEVFDERHRVAPIGRTDAAGEIDLALLEVSGRLPWSGLEVRSASTLAPGERLCAWRMRRTELAFSRERICGRLLRTLERPQGPPLLLMSHPYPPGTSGSALVDRDGRIVGIVTASTGEAGIAEPIDSAVALAYRSRARPSVAQRVLTASP